MSYKYWSVSEVSFLVENFSDKSDKDIASELNRSVKSIQKKARQLSLYKTDEFIEKVRRKTAKNISSGHYRYQFKKGDPDIFYATGSNHPNWVVDRTKIKGPRRRKDRFSPVTMRKVRDDQRDLCAYCFTPLSGSGEFDHYLPVCVGGTSNIENCQLLCSNCHQSKSRLDQKISNNYLDLEKLQEAYSFIARNLV